MSKIDKCRKCETVRGTKENHQCPYETDLNNNKKLHCNCCARCIKKCRKDIIDTVDDLEKIHRNIYPDW